ncbi:MAG TPA: hypothetical protein VMM18_12390 [Gemmatimonadaceae bacterium]|nr:hypothetical protein [Gemmatimonadaceae bacterium]
MASSVGLMEFFILEASDYVEQIDAHVARAGPAGPDLSELIKFARMLRGSSTMARQSVLAELAGALERVSRAVRDGALAWDAAVHAAVVAAIDDLKLSIRALRTWGPADEQRVRTRVADLTRFAPHLARPYTPTPTAGSGGAVFLATEASEIATALDRLLARPDDRLSLDALLARVRALRGVAAIKDLPPLADVVEAIERAAKPLELGGGPFDMPTLTLFQASATVMHRIGSELRIAGRPDATSPEAQRFAAAARGLGGEDREADHIVPIAELFPDDGQPSVVSAAPNPPTTPAERFRLEVVSQAEHLRRLVAEARQAADPVSRDRLARELRGALVSLRRAAESFGQREVSAFVAAREEAAAALDLRALDALDEIAALLANAATRADDLKRRLAAPGFGGAAAPGAPAAPAGQAAASRGRMAAADRPGAGAGGGGGGGRPRTPSGAQLQSLLATGIQEIDRLGSRPLSQPVPLIDESLVPIDELVYRGRAALDRARTLREEIRRGGGVPAPEQLDELLDLIELASTE